MFHLKDRLELTKKLKEITYNLKHIIIFFRLVIFFFYILLIQFHIILTRSSKLVVGDQFNIFFALFELPYENLISFGLKNF